MKSEVLSALSPAFKDLLEKRGFTTSEAISAFLHPSLKHLYDPLLMKGVAAAVARLKQALSQKEKVLIHGDYDVDGITGAALMAKTLQKMGIDHELFLPNREEDGYGVSMRPLEKSHEKKIRILITVDCGVTAHEQITKAKSLGLDVIVIDHHEIPQEGLPAADIILNPHQEDCAYPFGGLSAAGLVFKLSFALLGEEAFSFLDLAALSTVCDVAPLKDENRILVKEGLSLISSRKNIGLSALSDKAGIRERAFNTGHLGFALGPRINAAGRMSSPEIALRLLLTDNLKEAYSLAGVLDEENKNRQREEKEMLREAISLVERNMNFSRDQVMIVAKQGWHQGVIGIVAARLAEKYYRPAIVIALDGEKGKGSGRSIRGFALHEAFQFCASELEAYGGHAQAAGLTILESKVESFRAKMREFSKSLDASIFVRCLESDMELSLDELTPEFLKELDLLEPHGMGNSRPVFLFKGLTIKGEPFWKGPQTLKFFVTAGGRTAEAYWTDRAQNINPTLIRANSEIDLLASVKSRDWNGLETVSLEVKAIQNDVD